MSEHAPDCVCHVCQPYSEWVGEGTVSETRETLSALPDDRALDQLERACLAAIAAAQNNRQRWHPTAVGPSGGFFVEVDPGQLLAFIEVARRIRRNEG